MFSLEVIASLEAIVIYDAARGELEDDTEKERKARGGRTYSSCSNRVSDELEDVFARLVLYQLCLLYQFPLT
jgi:hypothetical protein